MSGPGGLDQLPVVHDGSSLRIRIFAGGPFQENGYLVECVESGALAVVDPGAATPRLVDALSGRTDRVQAIYLTHAHLDHVEGLPALRRVLDAPIHLHPADRFLYDRAHEQAEAFNYPLSGVLPPIDRELEPGVSVPLGETELEVRFAPGHAPGHVVFHHAGDGVALVGDVIFHRSIGRTDLPGGDMQELMESIRREILTLPEETRLLTGHGPETTVAGEKMGNPFLISQARGGLGGFA